MKIKKVFKVCFYTFIGVLFNSTNFAQSKLLSQSEKASYSTLSDLAKFIERKPYQISERDTLFEKFIYFDYILKDTLKDRVNKRIEIFDGLFINLQHFVDSVGVKNLDALSIRFFKNDIAFYKPFTEELKEAAPNTFAYFNKTNPNKPLGVILFEPKTHKIVAWIIIDQGGYKYFLTFNLF
ncbi:MAG: hypothetical protein QM541_02415 [Flavobacterium sp.]|nr:hypothetical protein [Flavobacterium sp.]